MLGQQGHSEERDLGEQAETRCSQSRRRSHAHRSQSGVEGLGRDKGEGVAELAEGLLEPVTVLALPAEPGCVPGITLGAAHAPSVSAMQLGDVPVSVKSKPTAPGGQIQIRLETCLCDPPRACLHLQIAIGVGMPGRHQLGPEGQKQPACPRRETWVPVWQPGRQQEAVCPLAASRTLSNHDESPRVASLMPPCRFRIACEVP